MKSDEEITADLLSAKAAFYVYVLYRLDGSPFYVGMGKTRPAWQTQRIFHHERKALAGEAGRKASSIRKILASSPIVPKAIDSWHVTKEGAFSREIELIAQFGRCEDGGTLLNLNAGGTGQVSPSAEVRAKMRAAQIAISRSRLPNGPHLASVLPLALVAAESWRGENKDRLRENCRAAGLASKARMAADPEMAAVIAANAKTAGKARALSEPDKFAEFNRAGRAAASEWRKTNRDAASALARAGGLRTAEWLKANPEQASRNARKAAASSAAARQEKARLRAVCREMAAALHIDAELPAWREPITKWQECESRLARQVAVTEAA